MCVFSNFTCEAYVRRECDITSRYCMMDGVFIKVMCNGYVFENLLIKSSYVSSYKKLVDVSKQGSVIVKLSNLRVKLLMNGILFYYFVRELGNSALYRNSFLDSFYAHTNSSINAIKLVLILPDKEIIDYSWNDHITYLVRERCELEHTLSWLSTLGGAFSALGDYGVNYAEIAGKISLNQLQLAFRLGDPNVVSRCRLYLSLSLIQQNRFKLAKRIVSNEYVKAKNDVVIDTKLINMCKGIWCKLKYEYQIYKRQKVKIKKLLL